MTSENTLRMNIGARMAGTLQGLMDAGVLDHLPATRTRIEAMIAEWDATIKPPPCFVPKTTESDEAALRG